jgi:hypothetical protein
MPRRGSSAGLLACLTLLGAAPAAAAPIGPNRVAVILFNFRDDPRQPITPAQAAGEVFGNPDSANAYWQEVSEGVVSLSGDVYGWVTIPADTRPFCGNTFDDWSNAAVAAAGVNAAAYDQLVFAFPPFPGGNCNCGLNTFDARRVFVLATAIPRCLNHELGHNFGLEHAAGYRCSDGAGQPVPMSADCSIEDYHDPFDLMGFARIPNRHMGNWQKMMLGFLSPAEVPAGSVKTVGAPGTFTLAPSAPRLPGQIQILRVPRTIGPDCGIGDSYYLEFRQPYGTYFDNFLPTDPVVNGVTIRWASIHLPQARVRTSPYLVDTNPDGGHDFGDAPLAVGRTFVDPVTGVSVRTEAVAPEGATVPVSPPPLGDADGDGFVRCLDNCPGTANPAQGDADADGLGDACDVCTTGGPGQSWVRPSITVKGIGDGKPGNDRAKIRGRITLPTGSFSVNPLVDGARLQLRTTAGEPLLDATLPGGSYVAPGPGWSVSAGGTRYDFRDGRAGGSGGVVKMRVTDRGGGDVQFCAVVREATLPLTSAGVPLQATVVLGDGAAGECGEVRFAHGDCAASASSARCRSAASATFSARSEARADTPRSSRIPPRRASRPSAATASCRRGRACSSRAPLHGVRAPGRRAPRRPC